jgi:hypothetical protein
MLPVNKQNSLTKMKCFKLQSIIAPLIRAAISN